MFKPQGLDRRGDALATAAIVGNGIRILSCCCDMTVQVGLMSARGQCHALLLYYKSKK